MRSTYLVSTTQQWFVSFQPSDSAEVDKEEPYDTLDDSFISGSSDHPTVINVSTAIGDSAVTVACARGSASRSSTSSYARATEPDTRNMHTSGSSTEGASSGNPAFVSETTFREGSSTSSGIESEKGSESESRHASYASSGIDVELLPKDPPLLGQRTTVDLFSLLRSDDMDSSGGSGGYHYASEIGSGQFEDDQPVCPSSNGIQKSSLKIIDSLETHTRSSCV